MEENQKLTQMGRLTNSIRFVDVSEKECQVSIDEYYTVMVIKRDTTPPIQINLNDIKSAKILPKVLSKFFVQALRSSLTQRNGLVIPEIIDILDTFKQNISNWLPNSCK